MEFIKKLIKLLQLIVCLAVIISCDSKKEFNDVLWYNEPAQEWDEALPLGNGKLGVMVFGKPANERIQLNDDSLWPADLGWDNPEGNKEDLDRIRQLLFAGKNAEADQLFVEKFSRKQVVRSHQTLGDLFVDFNHKNISEYKRELNISKAISNISYKTNGDLVTEKVFVSNPDKAIIIEFTSASENGLSGKIRLNRPKDNGYPTVKTFSKGKNLLIMQGEVTQRNAKFDSKDFPILSGVKFETRLKVEHQKGEIIKGEDFLELKNVQKAVFKIVSNSSYYFEDYQAQNELDLAKIDNNKVNELENIHIEDYRNLYSKVDFKLDQNQLDSIPINERLDRVKEGNVDLGLESLLFQYGRYLLISSSRKGTNPANLQGLWNQHITAPWNADYHLNINLQMNYWPANLTNLDELNEPLFDYIDKLVENGKTTASQNFGCGGTFIPHATDLWAPTWLRAPTAYWGCSVGGGGWLMQHYWQHYKFTKDVDFLKNRAFPAIKEVANFYSDWLIEDPRDGLLISAPSTSPENRFMNANGDKVATCMGSAMDQQIIAEVFDNYLEASEILNINSDLSKKIRSQRKILRTGFQIGEDGRVLEWDRPYEELEPGHRHMSHLYGFHPGVSVSKERTPEIFEAVKKTLDFRLENGGAGTGWSRAWLINCSARLLNGKMAHEHIQLLLQKSLYDNLFDGHPPFQIDGNFGYTAGVAEMLLQSHEEGIVRLLPALPPLWKTGSITGLKARGGVTVDLFWKNNKLEKAIFKTAHDSKFKLIYNDISEQIDIKKGETFEFLNK
jgi:alpha-L-fucosidase 2